MDFVYQVVNGEVKFATHRVKYKAKYHDPNSIDPRKMIIKEEEIYCFSPEDVKRYKKHTDIMIEKIPGPPPHVLQRANELKGKVMNECDFERFLNEKTEIEKIQEQIDSLRDTIKLLRSG